jgi:hypothetical protein
MVIVGKELQRLKAEFDIFTREVGRTTPTSLELSTTARPLKK